MFQGSWLTEKKKCVIKLPTTSKISKQWIKLAKPVVWSSFEGHEISGQKTFSPGRQIWSYMTWLWMELGVLPTQWFLFQTFCLFFQSVTFIISPSCALNSCLSRETCEMPAFDTESSSFRPVFRLTCKLDY